MLKLLSEQENGIEALKSCEQVIFTGSQCPDDLGDCLVERGVNLASLMGSYVPSLRFHIANGIDQIELTPGVALQHRMRLYRSVPRSTSRRQGMELHPSSAAVDETHMAETH